MEKKKSLHKAKRAYAKEYEVTIENGKEVSRKLLMKNTLKKKKIKLWQLEQKY